MNIREIFSEYKLIIGGTLAIFVILFCAIAFTGNPAKEGISSFFTHDEFASIARVLRPGKIFPWSNPDRMQRALRDEMKRGYMYTDGRIEGDPGIVRSESQSYGMLLAVLTNDRNLFDHTWEWTKANLRERDDHLFNWLWVRGKVEDTASASDADEDIALALIMAHTRWGAERYKTEALEILADIWEKDTKEMGGIRYFTAGDWALFDNNGITLNPSYFAPSSYRIFARFDPSHDWNTLVESSYTALEKCTAATGLAPNWCRINPQGEVVLDYPFEQVTALQYSYDALRIPFRIALDAALFNEPRAHEYLRNNTVFMRDWNEKRNIYSIYSLEGVHGNEQAPASYATALAMFKVINLPLADSIWKEEIRGITNLRKQSFYNLAWLWFGLEFYKNGWSELGNLSAYPNR